MRAVIQFLQFAAVGMSNAVIDLGLFNLLFALSPTRSVGRLTAYNSLAVAAAIGNSYLWNTRWTFRRRVRQHGLGAIRQRGLFVVQSVLNVLLNDLVVAMVGPQLVALHALPLVVASNLAKLLAMVITSSLSFLLMRWVVFV